MYSVSTRTLAHIIIGQILVEHVICSLLAHIIIDSTSGADYRNRKFEIFTAPKRSRGNQLIHRCLCKAKSISTGSDPESCAGIQLYGHGEWCLELRQG